MNEVNEPSFATCVRSQVELLNAGKPLAAFDRYFAPNGVMYANDTLFAGDAAEGRRKQQPFISAATTIAGKITDLATDIPRQICVFRNATSFRTADGAHHKIDGLCWQKWHQGRIIEERYYDGELMASKIADGLLINPGILAHD